jgi:hypothetical protein
VTETELRDAIARECSNPSLQDLRELLDLDVDTPLLPDKPATGESMEIKPATKSVQEHFMDMELNDRCQLIWEYKYAWASAALRARKVVAL